MTFFSRRFTQLFFRPISFYTRVAVGTVLQNDRRDSWPQRLPKRMCYGNIIPRNRWSSDQVPLQDRKVKKTVDFKGTKRVHIKTHKSDFARRFCTFQVTDRAENPQTMPLIIIFKANETRKPSFALGGSKSLISPFLSKGWIVETCLRRLPASPNRTRADLQ